MSEAVDAYIAATKRKIEELEAEIVRQRAVIETWHEIDAKRDREVDGLRDALEPEARENVMQCFRAALAVALPWCANVAGSWLEERAKEDRAAMQFCRSGNAGRNLSTMAHRRTSDARDIRARFDALAKEVRGNG